MKNITLNDYLAKSKGFNPTINDDLCSLIKTIANACKQISQAVSLGALSGVLGTLETENVQGEIQKKLDVISNEILIDQCEPSGYLAAMASEEMENIYQLADKYTKGPYLLLFDPLDGSSNIDVNVSIGTIFSILKAPNSTKPSEADFLQAGKHQIAAGYAIYGPQTMLILTLGNGVVGFTLNPDDGEWLLTKENITIPEDTAEFAINMSNMRYWDKSVKHYIDDCLMGKDGPLGKNYNMRWIASMVADVHRVLSRGGVFLYPSDARESVKNGKLRIMYEANPMSFLIEQAGGKSINGKDNISDLQPTRLHQRVSVILGSSNEVQRIQKYYLED